MVVVLRHCHLSLQGEIERGDSQTTESAAYDNYKREEYRKRANSSINQAAPSLFSRRRESA